MRIVSTIRFESAMEAGNEVEDMRRLAEEKVFKDPVHKYIYVQDPIVWDLINTKEFQRLRRIRQLGTSYLTFHGAEHSRFSHSLGVYELTRKIISQFERNAYSDWPLEEKLLCLCASLLHDVGHGPFSHSMEEAFQMCHEDWSCRLIVGNTEINRILSQAGSDFPERVASIIRKDSEQTIAVSLISSQLDVDRMDYLLRDAYFTGVNYGTFDLERILRLMRPHQGAIVIKESGMHAVEDYLMSRYQMYWQVYFHPVTRGSEILLRNIFQRAAQLHHDGYRFEFLIEPLNQLLSGTIDEEQYLRLDEALIQTTLLQWAEERDAILSDLCTRFMHRRLYKYIALAPDQTVDVDGLCAEMWQKGLDPQFYLQIESLTKLPYDVYQPGESGDNIPIWLLDEQDQTIEISERSQIVRSISGPHRGGQYVYYPEDQLDLSAVLQQYVK